MGVKNLFLTKKFKFFSTKKGIIFVGAFIGVAASILQHEGNPTNMGICTACFQRDISGALGFHSNDGARYLRPEIFGLVLGSLIASLIFKEFRARTGSTPIIRFFLGFFAIIGALVFCGCSWRAFFRLAGGDLNAILGIIGLIGGVYLGTLFLKNGFDLGKKTQTHNIVGAVIPAIAIGLLILLLWDPSLKDGTKLILTGKLEPGSLHAPIALSFGLALMIGFFAQRTRFCVVAGIRDAMLIKNNHLLLGVIFLAIGAFVTNLIFGQIDVGFENQPFGHNMFLWNYLGMLLAGLAFTLAGGCSARQLVLSGEGDSGAGLFVLGMFTGAAFSQNFQMIIKPNEFVATGPIAVVLGIFFCIIIGLFMRNKD